jgi:iron complex transport system ATP-binding protein
MIAVENVSKHYGGTLVVDSVSLSLPAGGITAIIGPNGAGKSTLLSMVSRLLPMDSGRVHVDGLDIATTPNAVLAKRLAILRQENQIAARLTVRDLVAFGRYPHSKGRPTIEDKRHIDEAIAYLNLGALEHRFLDQLSGGQRQRAHVAMVLAQDTDYVLLDEPLASLDMKHAVEMMRLLERAARDFGKTIVLVLHDINFASCYASHIVAMRSGKVCHQGSPAAIMQAPVLSEIYDLPIAIHEIDDRRIAVFYRSP